MKKIKILTVSNTVWSNENSFGITYNSLFDGLEDSFEFANIYCNYGIPENNCVKKYCQITEKTIIDSLKKQNKKCRIFDAENAASKAVALASGDADKHRNLKKHRLQISMWARDLVWKKGLRDMSDIVDFVKSFKPDIIFTPMYYMFHTNKILQEVIKTAKVPVIAYISDDIYRTRKFLCSPFYAFDRVLKRKTIKKTIELCDMLYVACDEQKAVYEKEFGKICKVLRKPADKSSEFFVNISNNNKRTFLYAGNLGADRWKTIAEMGKVVKVNGGILHVYSASPISNKIKNVFEKKYIDYKGYVSPEKVSEERKKADILVYAEGFSSKSIGLTHFSVSTKFSEYLLSGKTILAAGSRELSAIRYLKSENAAVIAESRDDLERAVKACMQCDNTYVKNAFICAERDFDKEKIQEMLKTDILNIAGKRGDIL